MQSLMDILAVMIGVVFIYLILSMIVSYMVEFISGLLELRGKVLANAVHLLLYSDTPKLFGAEVVEAAYKLKLSGKTSNRDRKAPLLEAFYDHPAISTLASPGKLPSYIDEDDFVTALLDIMVNTPDNNLAGAKLTFDQYLAQIKEGLENEQCKPLKKALMPYIRQVEMMEASDSARLRMLNSKIIDWYNSTMERASGWYKRRTQTIALIIGFIVALLLNADTVSIFQTLWSSASLRAAVNTAAADYITQNPSGQTPQQPASNQEQFSTAFTNIKALEEQIPFPLGWTEFPPQLSARYQNIPYPQNIWPILGLVLIRVFGLVITTFAISQGSSIWFQTLQKLIDLRNSGIKPAGPKAPPIGADAGQTPKDYTGDIVNLITRMADERSAALARANALSDSSIAQIGASVEPNGGPTDN